MEGTKERESMFSFGSGGATRSMFGSPAASFGSLVPGKDKKQAEIVASFRDSKDQSKDVGRERRTGIAMRAMTARKRPRKRVEVQW